MSIKGARLEVALAPGKISIVKLEGKAAGGDVLATAALERAPGGAKLAGDVRINGINLSAKNAAAALALDFSSTGATPGGLIAVAAGKGELALGDVSAHVPTPLAVVETSEAVLTGAAGGAGEALIAALREQMAGQPPLRWARARLRSRLPTAPPSSSRSSCSRKPDPQRSPRPSTSRRSWSTANGSCSRKRPTSSKPTSPARARFPPSPSSMSAHSRKNLDTPAAHHRRSAGAQLAIRRMELDADQLERLHKADAERARQDEERRRALAADQAARAAIPPQAPPQSALPPPAAYPPTAYPQFAPQAYGVRPGTLPRRLPNPA